MIASKTAILLFARNDNIKSSTNFLKKGFSVVLFPATALKALKQKRKQKIA